ncbi:2-phosphosulfolactate phosphatase [Streptomyces litchfieldiae]|uniref:Probable 2-phosphosulfolactate phosphatase n=1 Tax=Streptomyces litchfieldiae TaxID=3075543 RepID=A0ABU2MYK7_9ACTN|nr:2-phosphosulfolactate phosphatase [Streptomyces sp. DSM 44938]MDT0345624.1 2-phosphosulfolactate phosphatase [Streptomyces sp. DSM 44938]
MTAGARPGPGVRFDWGPAGAKRLAGGVSCLVVVDVLSFTTSVSVAVEAGTRVFPYAWRDGTAVTFAERVGARLAVGRRATRPDAPWSLSPAALRRAPFTPRLVLPSPNGSAISAAADGAMVVAACLRNGAAVGAWLAEYGHGTAERPVGVIAAGELRPDGSLRRALEDLLGAGAVIAALRESGRASLSPEAGTAADAFTSSGDVAGDVRESVSGRELIDGGFPDDVSIATELNACPLVPVLTDGAFAAPGDGPQPPGAP